MGIGVEYSLAKMKRAKQLPPRINANPTASNLRPPSAISLGIVILRNDFPIRIHTDQGHVWLLPIPPNRFLLGSLGVLPSRVGSRECESDNQEQ